MQKSVFSRLKLRPRALAFALTLAASLFLLGSAAPARAAGTDRIAFPGSITVPTVAKKAATVTAQAMTGTETVEFQVALRMRDFAKLQARIAAGERISQEEMLARYYPLATDYQAVVNWATKQGFTVLDADPVRLGVRLSGSARLAQAALATTYAHVTVDGQDYLAAQTVPSLPAAIAAPVLGINGLQPYLKAKKANTGMRPMIANAPPYLVPEILRAYNADNLSVTGQNQTIAILIDRVPLRSDLQKFWTRNSIPQLQTNVTFIDVNNALTFDPTSGEVVNPLPEGEETLDVSWSSGVAPSAKIRVYASGDLQFTSLDKALQRMVNDLINGNQIQQLSISLGLGELDLPTNEVITESQYFATIANFGTSVFVSTGDTGSSPDFDGVLQASYEASDPSVTAVGGTSLFVDRASGAVTDEYVWNNGDGAGGGGTSVYFARPSYQTGPGVPTGNMRVIPDVASAADPETGCYLALNGAEIQIGGTSWSAPTWAGFSALINEARANVGLNSVGLLNPSIYPLIGTNNFRDITAGNNALLPTDPPAYSAVQGYDEASGIGVPVVRNLISTLTNSTKLSLSGFTPLAGIPGTTVILTGTRLDRVVSVSFNGTSTTQFSLTNDQMLGQMLSVIVPAGATTGPISVTDDTGATATSPLSFTVLPANAGANDFFVNAQPLGAPGTSLTGSNVGATKERGEPNHAGNIGGASIWYRWTATANGLFTLNTFGSSFDTLLAVYTSPNATAIIPATVDNLTPVASNDDSAGAGVTSSVIFQATLGTTYYIAVDGSNPGDGSGPAEGTVVLNFADTGTQPLITDFTPQRGSVGRSVTIFGANFLTVQSVRFNGVAATFKATSNTQIIATVPPGATTGPISVTDSVNNVATSSGFFTVVPTPGNDLFVNSTPFTGTTAALTGSNVGATKEPGEPDHADNVGGSSVWFSWTAPAAGIYTFDTFGSDFDTLLAIYTGNSVSTLTLVAANDDAGPLGTSSVTFTAVAGNVYRIAIDGFNGSDGNYKLNLSVSAGAPAITSISPISGGPGVNVVVLGSGFLSAQSVRFNGVASTDFRIVSDNQITATAPTGTTTGPITVTSLAGTGTSPVNFTVVPVAPNDNFANSILLNGAAPISVTGTNAGATREAGEPIIIPGDTGGRSIWYTWTPPVSGSYTITTRGSDFDTILGVFTGSTVKNLTEVVYNDDDREGGVTSALTLDATRGTTYRIVVDGANGEAGNVVLSILNSVTIFDLLNISFEPGEGYSTKLPLVGQNGWVSLDNVTGGNGIITEAIPNLGQQAYVGLSPLANGATSLHAYVPLGYQNSSDNPVVNFSTTLKLVHSTNRRYDRFGFTVSSGTDGTSASEVAGRYFSLIFDNATQTVYYQLNTGSRATVSTGVSFSNDVTYTLGMQLNFFDSTWNATLNGLPLATNLPLTLPGNAKPVTTLTRISADWTPADPTAPGDNYMAFDDFSVSAPVAQAPVISLQPSSQTVTAGQSVTFSVLATGTPLLTYQWYFNGVPIKGATSPTYSIAASTISSSGRYTVSVTNDFGTVISLDAILQVSATLAKPGSVVSAATQVAQVSESGGVPGTVLLTRTGDLSQALVVNYAVHGTAISGIDYEALDGRVTFKAGRAKKRIKVIPINRGLTDGTPLKVVVKVISGNGYTVGADAKAKVTVTQN